MTTKMIQRLPDIRNGIPVIRGTRFPVYRMLAELSDGYSIHEISEEFDITYDQLSLTLVDLAILLEPDPPEEDIVIYRESPEQEWEDF